MKIAHIVRRYTKSEWGGTETVVENTAREQLRLGHDARIFCTSALDKVGKELVGGVPVERFPYSYPYWPLSANDKLALDKKGGSPYAKGLFRAVESWHPDVIHIHAGGRLAISALLLAERLGIPSVYSLHGGAMSVPKTELDEMMRPMRHKLAYGGILDRIFHRHFDPLARVSAVVCISKEEQEKLQKKYGVERIHYLPNGVNSVIQSDTTRKHAPGKPPKILCVSRIDYQKNQLALVEAMPFLLDNTIQLTLVGPITAIWYYEKIQERIKALNLENRVRIIPGLPPHSPELEAEFASADAFVLPSVHEPFGIVALEAMAHGLPLVASEVGGLRDFVKDGVNGLLFDPNADDAPTRLAQAIARALDVETAQRLVSNGHQTAKEFSWSAIVERLMELYQ